MSRGYKKDKEDRLSQLNFETPACQDMSFRAEELELRDLAVENDLRRNGKKGIRLCKEDFICDLK
jgi:hypothetical protein